MRQSLLEVLIPINLNDQTGIETKEVQHVATVRHLSFEFPSIHLSIAQFSPKPLFRARIMTTQ